MVAKCRCTVVKQLCSFPSARKSALTWMHARLLTHNTPKHTHAGTHTHNEWANNRRLKAESKCISLHVRFFCDVNLPEHKQVRTESEWCLLTWTCEYSKMSTIGWKRRNWIDKKVFMHFTHIQVWCNVICKKMLKACVQTDKFQLSPT